jgi:hypothetical protein
LAELIGSSRRQVNELLAEFQQQGAVIREGRCLILRVPQLKRIARIRTSSPRTPNS